jgi:hypothetical protein
MTRDAAVERLARVAPATPSRCAAGLLASLVLLAGASVGLAQDSVATVPGSSDALHARTGPQRTRYVVDLVPLSSSWGNTYRIAPILKASASTDPSHSTNLLGSAAISADVLDGVSFPAAMFAAWSTPGAGVHPSANSAPSLINLSSFDRQFSVAFSDIAATETNAIGAIVGINADAPDRLYVTRVVGLSSGLAGGASYSTIAVGGVDAAGNVAVRFDNFNTIGSQQVKGESLARIDLSARNTLPNTVLGSGATNVAIDSDATAIVLNAADVVTNVPAMVPGSLAGSATLIGFNFASQATAEGAVVGGHLASGIAAHRGNPGFSPFLARGATGVGTIASLARANGASQTQSINAYRVDASGQPIGAVAATLPTGLSDGTHTVNAAGHAEFKQYLSQVGFRGPGSLVGVGLEPVSGNALAAATAHDASGTEFVAAVTLGGSPGWHLVAYPGKPILNGPGGAAVGTIASASPATFSAPAVDALGNVYFVARYQPTGGDPSNALIKAVRTGGGYHLELLLAEGDTFVGANSATPFTITGLRLADSDSIASGTFHGGQLLPVALYGSAEGNPASPNAAGGLIVNARIEYDRGVVAEPYEAVLFIAPGAGSITPPVCPADLNGDGIINADDLGVLLSGFGCTGGGCQADLNGDGIVNADDLGLLLSEFGGGCD